MSSLKNLEFATGVLVFSLAVAVFCGVLAVVSRWEDDRFMRGAIRAQGEVTAVLQRTEHVDRKDGDDRYYYKPRVAFRTRAGKTVVFEGRYETREENFWKASARVPVLYWADDPSVARIDDPSQIYAAYRTWRTAMAGSLVVGALLFGLAKVDDKLKTRPTTLSSQQARSAYFGE